jgi:hypothetical protein
MNESSSSSEQPVANKQAATTERLQKATKAAILREHKTHSLLLTLLTVFSLLLRATNTTTFLPNKTLLSHYENNHYLHKTASS